MRACAALLLIALAAWPAAAARRESVTGSRFHIDPGEWRYFEFPVKEANARLDVQFEVLSPKDAGGIRARVLREEEFRRFRSRQPHRDLGATSYEREGRWRARLADAGMYVVVIDNRAEERRRSRVQMEIALTTGPEPENLPVKYASPRRRSVVIAASLGGFLLIAGLWGKALWRATRRRPEPPAPPAPVWF